MKKFFFAVCMFLAPFGAYAQQAFQQDVVSWTAPTQYEDGTPLSSGDIAEYVIYYGTTVGGPYTSNVRIPAPGLTVTIARQPPYTGKFCYVGVVILKSGIPSANSNEVCKEVKRSKTIVITVS